MTTTALQQALAEIQQPRSEYQLQHFVVNQHDTDPQRYRQCLIEIQTITYTLRTVKLELKKTELEIERLRATGDEINEIEAQIKEVGMEQTRLVMIGAERELQALTNIWLDFPKHYTHDEIEADQRDYWHQRLIRQARLEAMGSGRVGWAQLDALRHIGELDTATLAGAAPMLTGE
jgi:hypothetical protein